MKEPDVPAGLFHQKEIEICQGWVVSMIRIAVMVLRLNVRPAVRDPVRHVVRAMFHVAMVVG